VTLRESSVAHFGDDNDSQTTLTFGVEQSVLRQAGTETTSIASQQAHSIALPSINSLSGGTTIQVFFPRSARPGATALF